MILTQDLATAAEGVLKLPVGTLSFPQMMAAVTVSRILLRSYRYRAWMRQENAVPPSDPVPVCGETRYSLEGFFPQGWNTFRLTG
jgi:hypothetical protein